ncbi:MAG TPA: hypothetical protein VF042_05275, partial [Gemmatimonadaceae bacterium]
KDNAGRQQAATNHPPGLHGDKTVSRLQEMTNSGNEERERTGPQHDPNEIRAHNDKGRDRLFEDREQHDDADRASEKTRRARDIDRHDHAPDTELAHRSVQSTAKRKN